MAVKRAIPNKEGVYFITFTCAGKWNLVGSPVDYIHSSAKYYITGKHGIYHVTNYMLLADIDLTKKEPPGPARDSFQ